MSKYIERDAVKDMLKRECSPRVMAYLVGELCEIPAADVRPVVRGHIEEDENTYLFCSECNCDITLAAYETPDNRLVLRPNYCPNCGARMEES